MKRIKSDKILLKDRIISGYVYFENDKICKVTDEDFDTDIQYDFTGKYVSAGFIDTHTHGGGGFSFDGNSEDIIRAADFHLSHGTTTIYPTVSAAPIDFMAKATESIKQAIESKKSKSNIMGVHLEGPYLSASQCGGQFSDFFRNPDKDEYVPLIEKYGKYIARWTYAPENDIDSEFCKYITNNGIIASAGHTDATYDDMMTAKENGCNFVTHLYSCTSTITRDHGFRRLGVIETAYLDDDIFAEIIADGKHLPPELIRMILKIMGTDRIALTTDSLSFAGTDVKRGKIQEAEIIIEDGVCKLMDRSAFAGSIATSDRLIRVMTKEVGYSVIDAVKMLTYVPAQIMKINKGELSPDKDADIVVFDDDINIESVFVMGNQVV